MAKLDRRSVATLPGPPSGKFDLVHWDDALPGFGLRVLGTGRRSWIVRVRIGAKQRVVTLGKAAELDPGDARKQAREHLQRGGLGEDVRASITARKAAAKPADDTLGKLVALYLAEHVERRQKARSQVETRRYLNVVLKPLHGRAIASIERRHVAGLLASVASERGPIAANRARAAFTALFTWAVRRGVADHNPALGTPKPGVERARERVLGDDELRALWAATAGQGAHDAIVRLLLLTGQRREEVAGMAWGELDLAAATWTLPAVRTKNARAHVVPLSDAALVILSAQPRREGRALVFGEGKAGFSGWSAAKTKLDARLAEARGGQALEPWRLHDLRRTAVTGMAGIGIEPHVVEAVVNHVSGHKAGVAGVYNRATYAREKREALARWGEHVAALVEDRGARVVALRKGIRE